jgi:hypothetical protein
VLTTRHPVYTQKLELSSPTSSSRSVGTVRSWTQDRVFNFFILFTFPQFLYKCIRASEPISTYFINPSQSVCLCPFYLCLAKCIPPLNARQRLGKNVPTATNIYATTELLDACLWICLIYLSFPGNNSINSFGRQRKFVGCFVFSAVGVVSKESTRLGLLRASSFAFNSSLLSLLLSFTLFP